MDIVLYSLVNWEDLNAVVSPEMSPTHSKGEWLASCPLAVGHMTHCVLQSPSLAISW